MAVVVGVATLDRVIWERRLGATLGLALVPVVHLLYSQVAVNRALSLARALLVALVGIPLPVEIGHDFSCDLLHLGAHYHHHHHYYSRDPQNVSTMWGNNILSEIQLKSKYCQFR